jgi:hypothetical protein
MKRASDPRARHEVAAQMLDYAAKATRWSTAEKIAEWLEWGCQSENLDSLTQLRERLGVSEAEVASYWGRVRANLGSKIERELPAIVEFLDEQMRSVTVVALELSLFSNGSERILAPRLIGLTADAVDQKSAAGANVMKEVGAVCRTTRGSIAFDFDIGEKRVAPACLRANGKAAISLFNLAKFALFADKESRRAFCDAWPRRGSNCPQRA